MRLAPLVLAAALFAAPALAESTLTVTGEGRAAAAPDIATVNVGVETRAKTAAQAMAENAAKAAALIAAAKAAGVAPADIQTSDLSIWPVYEDYRQDRPEGPKLIGFAVSNQVTARLRDLSSAGGTLGALVEAGANRMNGIAFGFADETPLRDAARRAAVADAKRKAELYAEAAGVALGPIRSIEEAGFSAPPRPMMRAAAMEAASVPVEAGESELTASVTIVWEIGAAAE